VLLRPQGCTLLARLTGRCCFATIRIDTRHELLPRAQHIPRDDQRPLKGYHVGDRRRPGPGKDCHDADLTQRPLDCSYVRGPEACACEARLWRAASECVQVRHEHTTQTGVRQMFQIETSTVINRPVEDVFAVLSNIFLQG
jgi:hypothetical protein